MPWPFSSSRPPGCTRVFAAHIDDSIRAFRATFAPLPGYHWYLVPRFGYPDPDTFHAAHAALAGFTIGSGNGDLAHRARGQLEAGGLEVEYHESDIGHQIDPAHLRAASEWLDATLPN